MRLLLFGLSLLLWGACASAPRPAAAPPAANVVVVVAPHPPEEALAHVVQVLEARGYRLEATDNARLGLDTEWHPVPGTERGELFVSARVVAEAGRTEVLFSARTRRETDPGDRVGDDVAEGPSLRLGERVVSTAAPGTLMHAAFAELRAVAGAYPGGTVRLAWAEEE